MPALRAFLAIASPTTLAASMLPPCANFSLRSLSTEDAEQIVTCFSSSIN